MSQATFAITYSCTGQHAWTISSVSCALKQVCKLLAIVSVIFLCSKLVEWVGSHVPEIDLPGEAAAAQSALWDLLEGEQELHNSLKAISSRMEPALKWSGYIFWTKI